MATNAQTISKLNTKVNHLEQKFIQLNKRVSMLEADKENQKKAPNTPKFMRDESSASMFDSPLTRIVRRIERLSLMDLPPPATATTTEIVPKRRTISGNAAEFKPKSMQKKTSPRPFPCDVCKRVSCLTEEKLNEHKLNFHNFRCQVCERSFQKATERDAHEIKQHNLRKAKSILSSDDDDLQTENQKCMREINYNLRKRCA